MQFRYLKAELMVTVATKLKSARMNTMKAENAISGDLVFQN